MRDPETDRLLTEVRRAVAAARAGGVTVHACLFDAAVAAVDQEVHAWPSAAARKVAAAASTAATPAGPAPATDRTELRERIAAELARADGWDWAGANFSTLQTPTAGRYRRLADAVLARLPAPDQQAAVRAAVFSDLIAKAEEWDGHITVQELRRLAGEAQQDERCTRCRHPKHDHDGRADHREKYSPLVAGEPWCHACNAECDYTREAQQDGDGARSVPLAASCACCGHRFDEHNRFGCCVGNQEVRCGCSAFVLGEKPAPIDPRTILGIDADAPAREARQEPAQDGTAAGLLATPCDACDHTLNWHRNDVGCTVPRCVCGRWQQPTTVAQPSQPDTARQTAGGA